MDQVDSLADYLGELRDQTGLTLSSQQVSEIVALWQNLLDFDKQGVGLLPDTRHCCLTTLGFRSPKKKTALTSVVESLKRCVGINSLTRPVARMLPACGGHFRLNAQDPQKPKEEGEGLIDKMVSNPAQLLQDPAADLEQWGHHTKHQSAAGGGESNDSGSMA